uniref:cytochrome c oxidase subunit 2 n=1 Tax=Meteora sporadica TaxID=2913902 RepID=UPI003002084D|nr:cytochrome c oxidase subunit 2 [Meteora sporadica]WVH37087.1 cytochrome c oxidase subunit 2 [Meteora sporadica]
MKLIENNKEHPIIAPLYRHLTETNCDVPEAWQLGFQDPATPIAEGLIDLHHTINFFLAVILVFVTWLIIRSIVIYKDRGQKSEWSFFHGQTIEIVWTTIPALILIVIAVPSFALLYSMDEVIDPAMTIKVIGHQWYWSYEMSDNLGEQINYDSYMVKTPDLEPGEFRLLEVDNSVIVPTHTHIRVVVTSTDVIHSWAVPSLGIKIDACPGRLNQATFFIKRAGYYYGQCSEICGVNHAYMPICIEARDIADYIES